MRGTVLTPIPSYTGSFPAHLLYTPSLSLENTAALIEIAKSNAYERMQSYRSMALGCEMMRTRALTSNRAKVYSTKKNRI